MSKITMLFLPKQIIWRSARCINHHAVVAWGCPSNFCDTAGAVVFGGAWGWPSEIVVTGAALECGARGWPFEMVLTGPAVE